MYIPDESVWHRKNSAFRNYVNRFRFVFGSSQGVRRERIFHETSENRNFVVRNPNGCRGIGVRRLAISRRPSAVAVYNTLSCYTHYTLAAARESLPFLPWQSASRVPVGVRPHHGTTRYHYCYYADEWTNYQNDIRTSRDSSSVCAHVYADTMRFRETKKKKNTCNH